MLYDQHQINAQLPRVTVEKGQQLVDQQAVTELSVEDNGATLSAKVADHDPNSNDLNENNSNERVFISIHPQRKNIFTTECSCDMEENCSHVAAVLLYRLSIDSTKRQRQSTRGTSSFMNKVRSKQTTAPLQKANESAFQQLIYLISVNKLSAKAPITVELIVSEKQPSGEYRTKQPYHIQLRALNRPPRFLRMADPRIFKSLLDADPHWENQAKRSLPTHLSIDLLNAIVNTQRCYFADTPWQEADSTPISWGEQEPSAAAWRTARNGNQTLRLCSDNPKLHIIPAQEPFYIDRESNTIGALTSNLNKEALTWVSQNIKVEPEHSKPFIMEHLQQLLDWELPQPHFYPIEPFQSKSLTPQLLFYSKRTHAVSLNSYRKPTINDGVLPQFVYPGPREEATFFHGSDQTQQRQFHQGIVYQVCRDVRAEKVLMESLFEIAPDIVPLHTDDGTDLLNSNNLSNAKGDLTFESKDEWKQFFLTALPLLKKKGWQAIFEDDFRYHFVSVEQWYGGIEQSKSDWLALELGIQIDGEQINLLPLLVKAIEQSPEFFSIKRLNLFGDNDTLPITLDDGRIIELEVSRLKALLSVLVELFDQPKWDSGGKLRLPAAQQARVGELQLAMDGSNGSNLYWQGNPEILENASRFSELQHAGPIELPDTFNATLRDYQTIGVSWLQSLRSQGVSGILADDMGLGKTIQTLAHLSIEKSQGRLTSAALIIAPTSLLHNWRSEAARFTPELRVVVLHGSNRFKKLGHLKDVDIVVTTYALALRDIEFWNKKVLGAVILDEAQNIKNSKAKVAKAIKQIEAPIKLCLTGTPLENHLGELWSLFDFLMTGYLESESVFKRLYRNPIEKDNDKDRGEALFNRIAPFMMRRNKNEVLSELPPKTETVVHIPLAEEQQDLYETIRLSSNQKLQQAIADNGLAKSRIMILDALLKLRQVCCDPRLTKFEDAQHMESAKLQHLIEMVSELTAEGRRILIFSQFTSMLSLIADTLTTLKFNFVTLTGATTNREKVVEKFQNGDAEIFLISLKAGGVGLNLTTADTVIHYDPWWNPAAEQQATDRAYRIGQDKPVFVYKLLIENSVEEQIFQLQQKKLALMDSVYNAAEQQSDNFALSSEDLMAMLE